MRVPSFSIASNGVGTAFDSSSSNAAVQGIRKARERIEGDDGRIAAECRRSLARFVREAWPIVEPAMPVLWNWHIDAICEHLEAVTHDQIRNLLINVPPGHAKSLIVSVLWPAWLWIERPEWRGLYSSYEAGLAIRDSVRCRDVLLSEWYQRLFAPDWRLKPDQNEKSYYVNTRKGFRYSLGVGGGGTGWRGNSIEADDPLNALEAPSKKAREECIYWWDQVMSSRLNDMRSGHKIIIMQRLAADDLSGHVLDLGGYEHLCLPSEFEPSRRIVTSIGWSDPRQEAGELLFPELFTPAVLEEARKTLGESGYAGQHQQRPAPAGGLIFHEEWFENRYQRMPAGLREVWTCWDTALKTAQVNDMTAGVTVGLGDDGFIYVLRVVYGRWETPDVARRLIEQADHLKRLFGDKYRGDYVEDKQSGTTLMQYIRRDRPDLALIPIQVEIDKVTRAQGVTPICEGQRVRFPDLTAFPATRAWVTDTIAQLTAFGPNAAHDDIVDAFVYALKRFLGTLGRKKSRRGKTGGMV